jgi:hypothetical protein
LTAPIANGDSGFYRKRNYITVVNLFSTGMGRRERKIFSDDNKTEARLHAKNKFVSVSTCRKEGKMSAKRRRRRRRSDLRGDSWLIQVESREFSLGFNIMHNRVKTAFA